MSVLGAAWVVGGAGALAIAGAAYAFGLEPRWLEVTRHTVPVDGLPGAWDGLRLAHLTDFHLGGRGVPHGTLQQAVHTTIAWRPDVIVLTGDFSDNGREQPMDFLAPLAATAPTFAVMGNHDYFTSRHAADRSVAALRAMGITVLRNEIAELNVRGTAGPVAGLDDGLSGIGADVDRVLALLDGRRPVLTLTHVPDVADRFPAHWSGLTVAGHTHGAQVRLSPLRTVDWVSWPIGPIVTRYPRGWFEVNGNPLYVSRGLGLAGLPVRFGARPELACFTLTPAKMRRDGVVAGPRGALRGAEVGG